MTSTGGWTSRKRRKGAQKVPDPYKRLKRQLDRKRRREHFSQIREDQLLDLAYRWFTPEQERLDAQLHTQLDWLLRQQ
ncbi:hypothetical protein GX563_09905 [Candidatus Bathyarchaeota archaeon]|nr:hypothetical protein [Candidatus Bathyarchaeota archaeon]